MKSIKALLVIICITLAGCTHSGVLIKDLNHPLVQIKSRVIKNLPLGLKDKSSNGREFTSKYFKIIKGKAFNAKNLPVRKMVKIIILGDRRPYSLDVTVFVQKRRGRDTQGDMIYKNYKKDKKLAKRIANRIRRQLNNRRDDMNVIDDFKIF